MPSHLPNAFISLIAFLLFYYYCDFTGTIGAAATAVAAVDPEDRDNMLLQFRAGEKSFVQDSCAICYESIADNQADVFRDEAGLLSSMPPVDKLQLVARLMRMSIMEISTNKYGGSDIPKDERLAECSALVKDFGLELLRNELARSYIGTYASSRVAALKLYIDELTNTDRFNCEETFALADA